MKHFDALIFDLDGLLIDSERIYMRAWIDGAAEIGFDLTVDFYRTVVGMPYQECLDRVAAHFGPDFPVDRFIAASNRIRLELLTDGMKLKPGAVELLDFLAERNIPRAVASSSRRQYVTGHLNDLGVHGYFDAVVTRTEVSRGKPYPDPYLKAAEEIRIPPGRCLALEDSRNGIRSATAAGMPVVMVPDLLPPDAELEDICIKIATDLHEVRDWLAQEEGAD
ncbi:MAG: HAD family phosphatase [Alphaproteobacteria bacterium]|nr:HAD family phosphatase [Alphaproteobacteria bacterium]MCZ6764118.1 HAD family phosphatase [Alphaproteobacteria bacterium]